MKSSFPSAIPISVNRPRVSRRLRKLGEREPCQGRATSRRRFGSAPYERDASEPRFGVGGDQVGGRGSAARRRRCGSGHGSRSVTLASGPGRRRRTRPASRTWSARCMSCGAPTRFCGRHQRISPRRGSTAHRSDGDVHRQAQGRVRGRVDVQRAAHRPVDLPRACATAAKARVSPCSAEA